MPSESQSGSRIEEADCELYEGRAMTCPLLEALNIRQSVRILNKYPCLSLNFGPLRESPTNNYETRLLLGICDFRRKPLKFQPQFQ